MIPSNINICVGPHLLMPAQTWSFNGCSGLGRVWFAEPFKRWHVVSLLRSWLELSSFSQSCTLKMTPGHVYGPSFDTQKGTIYMYFFTTLLVYLRIFLISASIYYYFLLLNTQTEGWRDCKTENITVSE